jgi:translation machinery-associated protein 16
VRINLLSNELSNIHQYSAEVIDLTHPPTVELFRRWDQKEAAFVQLLRFIRIFKGDPQLAVLSRPGKHFSLVEKTELEPQDDEAMMVEGVKGSNPQTFTLGEASRFSNTIMDG